MRFFQAGLCVTRSWMYQRRLSHTFIINSVPGVIALESQDFGLRGGTFCPSASNFARSSSSASRRSCDSFHSLVNSELPERH